MGLAHAQIESGPSRVDSAQSRSNTTLSTASTGRRAGPDRCGKVTVSTDRRAGRGTAAGG